MSFEIRSISLVAAIACALVGSTGCIASTDTDEVPDDLLDEAPAITPKGSGYTEYQKHSYGLNPGNFIVPDSPQMICDDSAAGGRADAPCKSLKPSGALNMYCDKTIECNPGLFCMAYEGTGICTYIWQDE